MADRHPWDTRPHGPIQHALEVLLVAAGVTIHAAGAQHALAEARDIAGLLAETWLSEGRRRG